MELWELIARESARDLVARYNACGDLDDLDEMVALFADDAVMEVGPWGRHEGVAAIRAFFDEVRRPARPAAESGERRFIRHLTATHCIDVESPALARGRCYFAVLTSEGLDHWGRYVDRYVMDGDAWRFGHRAVWVEGVTPGGFADARRARIADA